MSIVIEKIESEIFSLIWQEVKKTNLSYIENLGYWVFYKNGHSIGLCTSKIWKQHKSQPNFHELISQFYANELLKMKRSNQAISIRVQGQSYCKFLETISGKGNGNVLVLCKFFADRIVAYYFVANCNNHTVLSDFLNDAYKFKNITDNVHTKIEFIAKRYNLEKYATLLFSKYVTAELFPETKRWLVLDLNYGIEFTKKQSEIMNLLASGYKRSKDIANLVNISPSTVDRYIHQIKLQIHLETRSDLVDYARKIAAAS